MNEAPVKPGWGIRGRTTYPTALTLESAQEARGEWELNFLVDDGLQATCFTYDSGDGKRRLGSLVCLDPSRRLSGTTIYVPQGELELAMRFFNKEQNPLEYLDCSLNLREWRFYNLPDALRLRLELHGASEHHKGLVETGGAHVRYAEKNYEDPLVAARRQADKAGFLSKATGMAQELVTLVVRCYIGAFISYNFFKLRTFKACVIAAVLLGLCSGRTIGGVIGGFFGSGCFKVCLVFLPIAIIAYLGMNYETYYEIVDTPGHFFGVNAWDYDAEELVEGYQYAIIGLVIAWIVLHPFFAKDEEDEKNKKRGPIG